MFLPPMPEIFIKGKWKIRYYNTAFLPKILKNVEQLYEQYNI